MDTNGDDTMETSPESAAEADIIQPINRETVHRICSGQVVLSLAIAVKELVENAIDASATNIEVCLKEYGSELVEVSDNGLGVRRENFAALTLKHYTSKIREFSDLESVSTLGFRGEALSSLCALADLSVTTRHTSAEHATKITYDSGGKIKSETPTARPQGTTVSLANLFSTLPVRRKEFLKNLKREFNKMCQLLYAYCLVSKGVKLTCTNQTSKGSKNTVVATQGLNSVRDNIVGVFGAKQISSLIDIELVEPEENLLQEFGIKRATAEPVPFKFECFVSSVTHGCGRSTADRQFYFINSRPCEPTKVTKLVNEVYRQFNGNQYPFVYFNITMESNQIDVNVTPDKRQIFLEKEKLLLATVKASLLDAFKNFPSTYKVQNLRASKKLEEQFNIKMNQSNWKASSSTSQTDFGGEDFGGENFGGEDSVESPRGVKRSLSEFSKEKYGFKSVLDSYRKKPKSENDVTTVKREKLPLLTLDHFNFKATQKKDALSKREDCSEVIACKLKRSSSKIDMLADLNDDRIKEFHSSEDEDDGLQVDKADVHFGEDDLHIGEDDLKFYKDDLKFTKDDLKFTKDDLKFTKDDLKFTKDHLKLSKNDFKLSKSHFSSSPRSDKCESNSSKFNSEDIGTMYKILTTDTATPKPIKKVVTMKTSLEAVREALERARLKEKQKLDTCIKFRSQITPDGNKTAEQELQKQITKEMFKQMKIVGQFNLGFVIAQLNNDLFIVDQHATDEKYNFEQLQLTTVLENQMLVNPKPLQLTSANEELLIDNEEVFKKNGFTFKIDHEAEATKKVALSAIPVSKNYIFGKDDIDEMLFMLQGSCNTMIRPSRVRAMFASRACRKSVMVGRSLSQNEMRRLVDHMGEIDQPWNCPHGRPTMRHLINLSLIQKE